MRGIKKMFKKVFTAGTAHLSGLNPKSSDPFHTSMEMIDFRDTVPVASAVKLTPLLPLW